MKAKSVSLWVIILSGVWVAVLALAKAMFPAVTGSELGLGVPEIIATGVFFVIIFTPVYRSIWLDKQLGAKMEEAKMNNANTDKLVEFVTSALKASEPSSIAGPIANFVFGYNLLTACAIT